MKRINERQANFWGIFILFLFMIYFGPLSLSHVDGHDLTWRGLISFVVTGLLAFAFAVVFVAWAVDGGWGRLVARIWNRLFADD